MALIIKDRVAQVSTTTGTGNFTLSGLITGYRSFATQCSVNDTMPYMIEAVDAAGNPTGDWETGIGTYSGTDTLTRTLVTDSSTGSAVNFAAGTKRVMICTNAYMVGGAMSLIDSFTFTGAEDQYLFDNIPQSFRDLIVVANVRSQVVATTSTYGFQFNGDTTSGNYVTNQINVVNSTVTGSFNNSNTQLFQMSYPGASATAGYSGQIEIDIIDYTNTTFFKHVVAKQLTATASGGTSKATRLMGGQWLSLSAITDLLFYDTAAVDLVAGSTIALYGRK